MSRIISNSGPSGRRLALQTRQGSDIDNWQAHEISPFVRNQFPILHSKFDVQFRTDPSPFYNCHGLTFAARRTCIEDATEVHRVLKEDGYIEVQIDSALPGDIILYWSDDGDVEHSGLVVSEPIQPLMIPVVVSKWGAYAEAVHPANCSPYSFRNAKFYRIAQ